MRKLSEIENKIKEKRLFLIIDTMMICDGGGMSGDKYGEIEMDDYVVGALILYMDIVMLFIYILQLFGKSDD